MRREPRAEGRLSRLPGMRCHRAHRFSRREQWRRYRNLIKAAAPVVPANAGTHSHRRTFCGRRQLLWLIERATRYGFLRSQERRNREIAATASYEMPISSSLASSRFQMAIWPILPVRLPYQPRQKRDEPCRLLLEQTFPTTLGDRLRDAYGVTAEFLSDIINETCRRFPSAKAAPRPPASSG